MSNTNETSVIVVGGSIVGLATSLFLAHRRVPHILIERHAGSSPHPRAIGYTTRTVELLRMCGLDEKIPQVGAGGKPRRVKVESLAGKWFDEALWTKSQDSKGSEQKGENLADKSLAPTKNEEQQDLKKIRGSLIQSTANPWSAVGNAALSQDKMEPLIRERAVELGADHRLGCKMTNWSQDEKGVYVTAVDSEGKEFTVTGKYLVGADGPKSAIREALGIKRDGVGYMRTLRSILFKCPTLEKYLDRGFMQFSIENEGFEAFITTYMDGRWALMSYDSSQEELSEEGQQALIRKAAGEEVQDISLVATGRWGLSAFIAEKFSSGRVFLAGDSAHTLPPSRGGYGANTGIADGHDLAWKLAEVLSGKSAPSLLDTYDSERRPIALVRHDQIFARDDYKAYVGATAWEHKEVPVIDDLAMELGQLYNSTAVLGASTDLPLAKKPTEWAGQPGTRAPHLWIQRNEKRISIIDTYYSGWTVVSQDKGWKEAARRVAKELGVRGDFVLVGDEVREEEEGSFGRLYGVESSGAVLVRPDGVIAWRAVDMPEEPAEVLVQATAQVAHVKRSA